MDLTVQTHTFGGVKDHTWLATAKGLGKYSATIATSELDLATHFPDGYVVPGTTVGLFTAGGNSGLWGPWVEDGSDGEEVLGGIVFEGFEVRRDAAGALVSARTVGSILLPQSNARIIVDKLPAGLLDDGTTANTATAAQLATAGFTTMNLGV